MEYSIIHPSDNRPFLSLYEEAFPPDERRVYDDETAFENFLKEKKGVFNVLTANENNSFIGFLSYWSFKDYSYIEHFAVIPQMRGKSIGGNMLDYYLANVSADVVIEVEHPSSTEAERRIGFYKKHGFRINNEFKYVQPPYGPGQEAVPMLLMTHGNVAINDYDSIKDIIEKVYGVIEM